MSPYRVHWDSHCSSMVARHVCGQKERHQKESFRYFSNHPDKRFDVGDEIFVMNKRHAFHKASAIFHPTFNNDRKIVRFVDRRFLPWVYHISNPDSKTIEKKLYAFQMLKALTTSNIMNTDGNHEGTSVRLEESTLEPNGSIVVHDVVKQNATTTLRSGKSVPGKAIDFYRITLGGKQDIVTLNGLRLLHKTFDKSTIRYGDFFQKPENKHLVLKM